VPELSISTWSLHRTLGPVYPAFDAFTEERAAETPYGAGTLDLLDAPAYVAAMGIHTLEICHFHFPRTDAAYCDLLRHRLAAAGVRLATLLIDDGDIASSDGEARERDIRHIAGWIDVARQVGAARARVSAGKTAADAAGRAVSASIDALTTLVEYARPRGIAIITENWQALAARPRPLLTIVDGLRGVVGLCADFGNYPAETREQDLRAILPHAVTVHAKAEWAAPGVVDATGFTRCLDLTREAGFRGAYVLIFNDPGDERTGILRLAELTQPYLH
jgi:sugar phosphate isomerase/epimerase